MDRIANSKFWRSVAVMFVLSLMLIGVGLFTHQTINLAAPAQAGGRGWMDVEGTYITYNQEGDTIYMWIFDGSYKDVELVKQKTFKAKK